ncbi:hypothetical protein BKA24_001792 [Microbacterium marinum]|uniref:Uncharacterized protein n=1 Tax=Microbacterium marinum TaxID=421115 RepID=A0A7W7BSV4_9MICO|nr:hypothetical protein [Microbacterium marinum]MBB4667083.1 hypothetical protein [Microbacterium marinum]
MSADQRTPLQYPTEAAPGVSWEAYFRDYHAARKAAARAKAGEDEPQEPVELAETVTAAFDLTPAQIAALPPRSTPAQVCKRLTSHRWELRVQQSIVSMPPVRYVEASKEGADNDYAAGDVRYPGYYLETVAVGAVKRDATGQIRLAMHATWGLKRGEPIDCGGGAIWLRNPGGGGFQIAQTYDPLDGREIRVGYTKGREPNEIELEEEIPAPLGLKEWLADFAPTAADKKAAEKKAAARAADARDGIWDAAA